MDTLPTANLNDYQKVREAILQMFYLSPEASCHHLREIEFVPDYNPHLIGQKMKEACLQWLHLETRTKGQIVEDIMVEHYTALLPFKPPNWVLCNKLATLKHAITLMEAYASAEAGLYLIRKGKKKEAEGKGGPHGRGSGGPQGQPNE